MNKILLAEDDRNLGQLLSDFLSFEGYEVSLYQNGEDALTAFQNNTFDLCLFDIMMPKLDGFSLVNIIRKKDEDVPIIFITAKDTKEDKIKGFKKGADDYITKPFDEDVLLLKINALLKRTSKKSATQAEEIAFSIGQFTFDYQNYSLINGDWTKRMTSREGDVLKMLCVRKNSLVKREDILISIWGENNYFHGRSLDVFITKLRKYLKGDEQIKIENVHGVGFILSDSNN